MKKHPVAAILIIAILIVAAGASVAYYNTKSFGFDEDAVIFLQEDDGFTLFDYKVYYSDVEEFYETSKEYIPDEMYSTDPYLSETLHNIADKLSKSGM